MREAYYEATLVFCITAHFSSAPTIISLSSRVKCAYTPVSKYMHHIRYIQVQIIYIHTDTCIYIAIHRHKQEIFPLIAI